MIEIEALQSLRNLHINNTYKGARLSVVLTHAIEALMERTEWEKGCEYCALCNKGEVGVALGLEATLKPGILPFVSVRLVEHGIKVKGLKPNYCPMCGKLLEGPECR